MEKQEQSSQPEQPGWVYLEPRPRSWRKQLYVKGKPFKALDVYEEILATNESLQEASLIWGMPIEAIEEVIRYCRENQDVLRRDLREEHHRVDSIARLGASARSNLKRLLLVALLFLPIVLVFSVKEWLAYAIYALLFVFFLRFVKELPVVGRFWVSCFGDNSLFEWIKITVIPVSVLFLGASITSAINSRQSEANIEKSRYEITQEYLDMFDPGGSALSSILKVKQVIADRRRTHRMPPPLEHNKGKYTMASNCYAFPESAWLTNQTSLALGQLSGLRTTAGKITAQKRYILQLIQKEGLISVGGNVISLRFADLSDSNLVMADLRNACLESVLFSDYDALPSFGSDLRHAQLDGSDLTGANLKNANLRSASLSGADLRGFASLKGADLRGANLSQTRIDQSTELTGARFNDKLIGITSHRETWPYALLCNPKVRQFLRKTYFCLDSLDYKNLIPTLLPLNCNSSSCQSLTPEQARGRGMVVDNGLPYE